MSWITANKGAGPWALQEQSQKLGYVNNPRWTAQPASEIEHEPCGYWLKGNKETLFESGPLWGAGTDEYGQLTFDSTSAHSEPLWYTPDFNYVGLYPCFKSFRENPGPYFHTVSSGGSHTALLLPDGTLWVCGLNSNGELGLGDLAARYNLKQVGTDVDWAFVTCGNFQTFAIKTDGTLWATGDNTWGQLGLGDTTDRNIFTQISEAGWKWVSSGIRHTIAIKTDGTLWATGDNSYGATGQGNFSFIPTTSFTQVGSASNWITAHAGAYHTVALNTGSAIYGTGLNLDGELGLDDLVNRNILTQTGNNTTDWKDCRLGGLFSVGMKYDGSAWTTGWNFYGQLALGDTTDRKVFTQILNVPSYRQIACGDFHMLLIGTDNSLWAVGHNAYGELGLDDSYGPNHNDQHENERHIFTRVGTENNWLKLWDTGFYSSSVVLRTPGLVSTPGPPTSRPTPVWPMPS